MFSLFSMKELRPLDALKETRAHILLRMARNTQEGLKMVYLMVQVLYILRKETTWVSGKMGR